MEELNISTQTYVVKSDCALDLQKCYDVLSDAEGVKFVSYKNLSSGTGGKSKPFSNCLSLIIMFEKKINIKMFKNGTLQYTGCKRESCVVEYTNSILSAVSRCCGIERVTYYVIPVMTNVDFNINCTLDKSKTEMYMYNNVKYYTPSLRHGYMGIKLKIPTAVNTEHVDKVCWTPSAYSVERVAYNTYYTDVHPNTKQLRQRYISVFIFQNGKILMSGLTLNVIKPWVSWFTELVGRCKDDIELCVNTNTFRRKT